MSQKESKTAVFELVCSPIDGDYEDNLMIAASYSYEDEKGELVYVENPEKISVGKEKYARMFAFAGKRSIHVDLNREPAKARFLANHPRCITSRAYKESVGYTAEDERLGRPIPFTSGCFFKELNPEAEQRKALAEAEARQGAPVMLITKIGRVADGDVVFVDGGDKLLETIHYILTASSKGDKITKYLALETQARVNPRGFLEAFKEDDQETKLRVGIWIEKGIVNLVAGKYHFGEKTWETIQDLYLLAESEEAADRQLCATFDVKSSANSQTQDTPKKAGRPAKA